jgi:succinoglycan biosynthesis transport protein ExoP
MDIILLLKVIWRKKWILLVVPIIAGGAAYFFMRNTVNLYLSAAQISTGFTTNDQVQLTDEKFSAREIDVKFSNLLNSMNSGIATNLVSYRLLLHDIDGKEEPFHRPSAEKLKNTNPREIPILVEFLKRKLLEISPLSTSDPEYKLVHKYFLAYGYGYSTVKQYLSIARDQNTDFIKVSFISDNANLSALAANSFCEEFIRYYKSFKTERTGESVEFLRQLVEEKRADLDEKLETQKIFKSDNGLMDIQQDGGQLASLEGQRDDIRTKIHRLELTRTRLSDELKSLGGSTSNNTTNANAGNQRIIYLRERINRLNEQYITGGSSNQVLLDSLNKLRGQLNEQMDAASAQLTTTPNSGMSPAELRSKLKDADIEYQVEKSNLVLVEAKIQNLQYIHAGHASKEAKLTAIQKEVDLTSQEYLSAVEKYNESKNRLLASNSLRQTIVAIPPAGPESSKKMLIVGLAAFSSMAICFFIIVGMELLDLSIKTFDKFKRVVNLPLAGTINKVESKNFNIRHAFSPAGSNDDTEMYKSLLRKLRHEIENMNSKVILFTSPKKKDGKTFVIFSLAYVLSLINKRVLIIDTNFKNNSLSQILAKPQGEIKVIEGKKSLLIGAHGQKKRVDEDGDAENEYGSDNTYDLINPTKYKNIYVIGNGGGDSESPAEILSGRNFNNLIEVLSESFDYILMEGASLNDYSDTKELVRYADKVVAVFSAESSIKQMDKESITYFKSLGNKFGGSVLNKVETKDMKL